MLRVTWEWVGIDAPALDVADTVGVAKGSEYDMLAPEGEYERWAAAAATSAALGEEEAAALVPARPEILELRTAIRAVLHATVAGDVLSADAVAALNAAARSAPTWPELRAGGDVRQHARGSPRDRLLAIYARSAIELASGGREGLRICPAPSCGMFYRPRRESQRWCSTQCGTRARVARHYRQRSDHSASERATAETDNDRKSE